MEYKTKESQVIQNTEEWLIERLGTFNSSEMGKLFKGSSTKKNDIVIMRNIITYLSDIVNYNNPKLENKVLDYINQVAASKFAVNQGEESVKELLNTSNFQTKNMQYGHINENNAANFYSSLTGTNLRETGGIFVYDEDDNLLFRDSPDRITNTGIPVEIKCPTIPVWHEYYKTEKRDLYSLYNINCDYFYQVIFHMIAAKKTKCIFLVYNNAIDKDYIEGKNISPLVIWNLDLTIIPNYNNFIDSLLLFLKKINKFV